MMVKMKFADLINEQEDLFGFNPYNEGLSDDQMNALIMIRIS